MCVLYARHILKIILCLARERMQEFAGLAIWWDSLSTRFICSWISFLFFASRHSDCWKPCRRRCCWTMATLMLLLHATHCKCNEGNFIRLNEDFIDLIMANKRLMCLARLNGIHFLFHKIHSPLSIRPLLSSQVTKEMNIQAVWYTISTNYQEYKWILSLNSYMNKAHNSNWNAHKVCPR